MPYALETRKEGSPAQADGFILSDLWLIPLLLLVQVFTRFRQHLTDLKAMRRTRPLPQDWQSFYPSLRQSEWGIRQLCHEGARRILSGEDLDLASLTYTAEPPDSFQPAMPRSALAMHQRIEDAMRFHADPERYIRRHAERVRNSDCDNDRERNGACDRKPLSAVPIAVPLVVALAVPVALAIRGPP